MTRIKLIDLHEFTQGFIIWAALCLLKRCIGEFKSSHTWGLTNAKLLMTITNQEYPVKLLRIEYGRPLPSVTSQLLDGLMIS
jgi:hypothetical protein